jgi:hypothetical protein
METPKMTDFNTLAKECQEAEEYNQADLIWKAGRAVFKDFCSVKGERFTHFIQAGACHDAALLLIPDNWYLQHLGQIVGGWGARIETNGPPTRSLPAKTLMVVIGKTSPLAIAAVSMQAWSFVD